MKQAAFLASALSLVGCSGGCPAIAYPAVEVVLDGQLGGGGAGGAGGASDTAACTTKLVVTDLDAEVGYDDCERVYVNGDPGTYRLRIEYGDRVEERTVEVPERQGQCGGSDTVRITAFERSARR